MKTYLHTLTCSTFRPALRNHESHTMHVERPRRLTLAGCQRIIRRDSPETLVCGMQVSQRVTS